MSAFADHKRFRESLPGAPPVDRIYTVELVAKEAAERQKLILEIPDPKQRGLKILEYVATLAPLVGAFAGPQGAAIGAAVSTLATIAHKMIDTETITPEDIAGTGGAIQDIIAQFQKAKTDDVSTAALGAVAALTAGTSLAHGHIDTNPHKPEHKPDPGGHTDHHPSNHHPNT